MYTLLGFVDNLRLDIVIVTGYLVLCLIIGVYKVKGVRNIKEYTLGSGTISTFALVATLFATKVSATTTTGTVEKIYMTGIFFVIIRLIEPVSWLTCSWIFGRNAEQFRGCLSISDIMQRLYGATGKWITNIASVLLSIGFIAVQVAALGYVFNSLLGVSNFMGVMIGFGIVTTYSVFGAIRSVIITDILQFIVFYVALPVVCMVMLKDIGGLSGLVAQLPPSHLTLNLEGKQLWTFIALIICFIFIPATTSGTFVQRILIAKDSKQLTHSLRTVAFMIFSIYIIICLIGFIVAIKTPGVSPNIAFFHFINSYLPMWAVGLIIAGILAAIMSTADSWLNTASVLCAHDIGKALFPNLTNKQELWIARAATVAISGCAIFLALEAKSILDLVWCISNIWDPIIVIPLTFGFLRFRTNALSFISSCVFGLVVTCAAARLAGEFGIISTVAGVFGSAIGFFGMHYFQVWQGVAMPVMAKSQSVVMIRKVSMLSRLLNFLKCFTPSGLLRISRMQFRTNVLPTYAIAGALFFYYIQLMFYRYQLKTGVAAEDFIGGFYLLALMLLTGAIMKELLPQESRNKYFPMYWYSVLVLCLPFFSTYALLLHPEDQVYIINFVLSTFLFAVFMNAGGFVVLTVVGVGMGLGLYLLMQRAGHAEYFSGKHLSVITAVIYSMFGMVAAILAKQLQVIESLKMHLIGGAIAHEVRSPLVSTQAGIELIGILMQNAIQDSKGAKKGIFLSEETSNEIKNMLDAMKTVSKSGLSIVDMLLAKLRGQEQAYDIGRYRMAKCIKGVLLDYQFDKRARQRISFREENDFEFEGSWQFVKHTLLNILNNALKYAGGNATIEIWIEDNRVYIRDNGKGISPDKLPYIFDALYTQEKGGTGIGLAFCREVMENLDGTITCQSEEGKYTEFVLTFPKIETMHALEGETSYA